MDKLIEPHDGNESIYNIPMSQLAKRGPPSRLRQSFPIVHKATKDFLKTDASRPQ